MSLLRRRAMMQELEQDENVIYLYSGYLPVGGNVNDEPTQNSAYPNAICSSPIFFRAGSLLIVTYANAQDIASRMYNTDGSYRTTLYNWDNQSVSIDCYLRLLAIRGADISAVKVTKSDGTEINYKIIDRR